MKELNPKKSKTMSKESNLENKDLTATFGNTMLGVVINPNWNEITTNETVIALIKVRNNIENIINDIDDKALINYELWKLSLP